MEVSTPLSNFEANLNYKDTQDPSVTVKFALTSEPNTSILAWTTTPWTLPSNLALCAGPNLNYVCLQPHGSEEKYWIQKGVFRHTLKKAAIKLLSGVIKELEGLAYEPIFRFADGRVDFLRHDVFYWMSMSVMKAVQESCIRLLLSVRMI